MSRAPTGDAVQPLPRRTPPDAAPAAGLRDLLPLLRPHRRSLALAAGLSLAGAAAALAQPALVARVINAVGRRPVAAPAGRRPRRGAAGGRGPGRAPAVPAAAHGGGRRPHHPAALTDRLLRLPVAEYDRRRTGDLMSRVGADTTLLRATVTSGVVEVAGSAVVGVGALVAMALVDGWLLLVTVVAVGSGRRRRQHRGPADQAPLPAGAGGGRRDDRGGRAGAVRGAHHPRQRRHRPRGGRRRRQRRRGPTPPGVQVARVEAMVSPASSIAVQGAFLAVLGLGGYRVATGSIDVADLVAFILYLFLLVMPLGQAISAWTQLQTGLGRARPDPGGPRARAGGRRPPGARRGHRACPGCRRPATRSRCSSSTTSVRLSRRDGGAARGLPHACPPAAAWRWSAPRVRASRRSWRWSRASTR